MVPYTISILNLLPPLRFSRKLYCPGLCSRAALMLFRVEKFIALPSFQINPSKKGEYLWHLAVKCTDPCTQAVEVFHSHYMLLYLPGGQLPHPQGPQGKRGSILMLFLIFLARRPLAHPLDLRGISPPNFQPMKYSPLFSLSRHSLQMALLAKA